MWPQFKEISDRSNGFASANIVKEYNDISKTLTKEFEIYSTEMLTETFASDTEFATAVQEDDDFQISPQALENLLGTITVTKNGQSKSYRHTYGIPPVDEDNKRAVMAHLALNLTYGDLAKGFEKEGPDKVSMTQYTSPMQRGFKKYEPRDIQPYLKLETKPQTVAIPPKKPENPPKKPGLWTRMLAGIQRTFNIDGKAKRAMDNYSAAKTRYDKVFADWKKYDETIGQKHREIDRKNAEKRKKYEEISEKNVGAAARKFHSTQQKIEKEKQDELRIKNEASKKEKTAQDNFDQAYKRADAYTNMMKTFKVEDKDINTARKAMEEMSQHITKIKDPKYRKKAIEQTDYMNQRFNDCLEKQKILRGEIKDTNVTNLGNKYNVNTGNSSGKVTQQPSNNGPKKETEITK